MVQGPDYMVDVISHPKPTPIIIRSIRKSQTLMRSVKCILFFPGWNPYITFFLYPSCFKRFSMHVCDTPSFSAVSMTNRIDYCFDLVVIQLTWTAWTWCILEWKISRTEFSKPILTLPFFYGFVTILGT